MRTGSPRNSFIVNCSDRRVTPVARLFYYARFLVCGVNMSLRITHITAATVAILVVVLAAIGCARAAEQDPGMVLQRAVDYLVESQGEDGGWHSPTYGFLRDGQAWTPFVLYQLALVREQGSAIVPDRTLSRGADFIRAHVSDKGVLGTQDPDVMEYPNYATSYAIRALLEVGTPSDKALIDLMVGYLYGQQYSEQRGIDRPHLGYGSWGFGEKNVTVGRVGHVDLSHTRRVIEALSEYEKSPMNVRENDKHGATVHDPFDTAMSRASVFLAALQKHPSDSRVVLGELPQNQAPYDGGFYSSPVIRGTNKAGSVTNDEGSQYFVSYATTTCDGLISLLAAGVALDDERIRAATAWLAAHQALDRPEGISPGQPGDWERVMFFYHLASRARIYDALDWEGDWRGEITALLIAHQQPDGSYSNPDGGLNKEDDPVLATALAVEALAVVVAD